MSEFRVPELGEGVHEGELVKWCVAVGDTVKFDQPLCEVMTDKATVDMPSPFSGKVTELHHKEGDVIKVGDLLVSYSGGGASASAGKAASAPVSNPAPVAKAPAPSAAPTASAPSAAYAGGGAPVMASPATRKFARENNVELSRVTGSGPHGRILKEDVEKSMRGGGSGGAGVGLALSAQAVTPTKRVELPRGGERRIPIRGLRKKIAEKMRLSKDRAAHFTYVEEADATELVKLREQAKALGAAQGVKVTYLPFIMKAMVGALRQFPDINSLIDDEKGEIVNKFNYNIGLSIQTEDGLTAPVVKNVEHKSILEIAREIQELVNRAKSKRLTLEDFQDGTITLTNAGSIGGLFATPVINYPEVAILGFNKIFKKPVVKTVKGEDKIVVRNWTYFSISLDHRVVDGAVGAEFMNTFVKFIENPSLLLLESF